MIVAAIVLARRPEVAARDAHGFADLPEVMVRGASAKGRKGAARPSSTAAYT